MISSTPHGEQRDICGAAPANASTAWPGDLAELAASIAHEANQPLAAIVAQGDASLRWLDKGEASLDEVRAGIEAMIRGALRTSNIIRGLCAFATKDEQRRLALNLNDLIEETVAVPEARKHVLDGTVDERWFGPLAADAIRNTLDGLDAATLAPFLTGGITKR